MKNSLDTEMKDAGMADEAEIWINEFTEESVQLFRRQVFNQSMRGPDYPITIYIDSYGGAADSLMAMLDIMESVPNPFVTVAIGKACSSGAILLSAGDHRYCGRHTRVMVHRVQAGTIGNMREMTNNFKEIERIDAAVMEILAENCGLDSKEELFSILKNKDLDDLWMSAEEAKAFGLIDHVGMPRLVPMVQWGSSIAPIRDTAKQRKALKKQTETDNIKKHRDNKPPKRKPKSRF